MNYKKLHDIVFYVQQYPKGLLLVVFYALYCNLT